MHNLVADGQGLALLSRRSNGTSQLHVLAQSDGRAAWSGMQYWGHYHPSRVRAGLFAYCITDRPVYRPKQTVHFKIWLRAMREGIFENQPDRQVHVTVLDPRGNKVHEVAKRTDQFGGLDSEFQLPDECVAHACGWEIHDQGGPVFPAIRLATRRRQRIHPPIHRNQLQYA